MSFQKRREIDTYRIESTTVRIKEKPFSPEANDSLEILDAFFGVD
jgi:hypothetical protein